MSQTIRGIFRNGRVELLNQPPSGIQEGAVLVTFLEPGDVNSAEHRIDEEQAAALRLKLAAFAEDWDSAEMSIYDDYDRARAQL